MPKEYIERKALIEGFTSDGCRFVYGNSTVKAIVSRIMATPAADVVEVVHGEWELKHEGYGHYWECSVCHTNPCIYVTENTKFCPNCGAKMDGERKEA